jgi:heme oxygenase
LTDSPCARADAGHVDHHDPAESLSAAFRRRTHALHARAERSGIVSAILNGRATRRGYGLLIRNLLPVYRQIELELEGRRNEAPFDALAQRGVYRGAALEADLEALFGADWRDELLLLPAGGAYARRIATLGKHDRHGLIAHAYVRYLGDLNGGQVLKKLLTRSLGLPPEALAFYDFPDLPDLENFRIEYRRAIDRSARAMTAIKPVIEEAAIAFEMNIELSEAIALADLPTRSQAVPGAAGTIALADADSA